MTTSLEMSFKLGALKSMSSWSRELSIQALADTLVVEGGWLGLWGICLKVRHSLGLGYAVQHLTWFS